MKKNLAENISVENNKKFVAQKVLLQRVCAKCSGKIGGGQTAPTLIHRKAFFLISGEPRLFVSDS